MQHGIPMSKSAVKIKDFAQYRAGENKEKNDDFECVWQHYFKTLLKNNGQSKHNQGQKTQKCAVPVSPEYSGNQTGNDQYSQDYIYRDAASFAFFVILHYLFESCHN